MWNWQKDFVASKSTIDFGRVHFTSVIIEHSTDGFDCPRYKGQLKTLIRLLAQPPIPSPNYLGFT